MTDTIDTTDMTDMTDTTGTAGWYNTTTERQRWRDNSGWEPYADGMPLAYNRQQEGHSIIAWICIVAFTGILTLPVFIYYCISPSHFWHL